MLTEPQEDLHDGYTCRLDVVYTNIAGKKHSKNTKQKNKSYNKSKRWTHELVSSLVARNAPPN